MADDDIFSRLQLLIDCHAQLLICVQEQCCFALSSKPAQVNEHLRKRHSIPIDDRRRVVRLLKNREPPLLDPANALLRQNESPYDPNLPLFDGFSCKFCDLLTISSQAISRHVGAEHEKRRLELQVKPKAMYEPVYLQAWTKNPIGGRYWIVEYRGTTTRPIGGKDVYSHLRGAFKRERRLQQGLIANEVDTSAKISTSTFTDLRPWLERTGWEQTYQNFDHGLLRNLTTMPSSLSSVRGVVLSRARSGTIHTASGEDLISSAGDEQKIAAILVAVDMVMDRCEQTARTTSRNLLCWLRSVRPHGCYAKPFTFVSKAASRTKYIRLLKRFIAMVFHAFCLPTDVCRRRAGIRFKRSQIKSIAAIWSRLGPTTLQIHEAFERWAIRFTDEQWSLLGDVAEEVERDRAPSSHDSGFFSGRERQAKDKEEEEDEEDEEDEDGDEDEDKYQDDGEQENNGMTSPLQDALDRAVFRFIVASIKTHVGGNVYMNSLLCFCAALGIKPRPMGYIEPHLYTGLLAAMVWWARLFFLEAVFENQPLDRDEVGVEAVLAFEEQHRAWMCMGTHTVMSTIIGWMAYGKGYRQKMGGQPSIRWSEDGEGLFHMGEYIDVEDFTRTLRDEVVKAEKLLDKLFGGFWHPVSKKINMGRIVDNMIRLGAGQSFTSNPKNKWLEAGPAKVIRLMEASIWDATRVRWKRQRVKRWLRDLKLLRETLLVLVHTWGGLPGRGPEITTLRHCDSWQLIRNIFIMDGQVMIVTDRDKMKAIRDNGRKVARFVPDRIGRMIVAYIAWLLPTERVLRRECQLAEPRGEQLEYMWRDGSSPVWETDRLS
ncbi:hypothetical protein BKA60DRAFT_657532, partial [Fusarium oxysporum]